MNQKNVQAWTNASLDQWLLGVEAASVMLHRMLRIAAGGVDAAAEVELMVREKTLAALELQARYLAEGIDLSPLAATQVYLAHYRHKVAANSDRLQRIS